MTPAPSAGGEGVKKQRNRRRSRSKSSRRSQNKNSRSKPYAKRVDEVSAGGLVVDQTGTKGLLIGRIDARDKTRE
ncbi:MAG: NUDIX hydrolase, partial [bacterium]